VVAFPHVITCNCFSPALEAAFGAGIPQIDEFILRGSGYFLWHVI